MQRQTMKFVATKTADQFDLHALHRVRERFVGQRTGIINQIRAFMPAEFCEEDKTTMEDRSSRRVRTLVTRKGVCSHSFPEGGRSPLWVKNLEVGARNRHVRFHPDSYQTADIAGGPFRANSRHVLCARSK
jgi:hypothetical protein